MKRSDYCAQICVAEGFHTNAVNGQCDLRD